ncbi:MAG: DUF1176 domain-containing protein [Phyllobacteriaceae bacterium]|nr:DUF1176 domain-containing protein [Phyllobacteriaceae bacterium]
MRIAWRTVLVVCAAFSAVFPALADEGLDKARAMMVAMHGERCAQNPPPDEDWADRAWPLQWRDAFQAADEPDRRARLMRLYCDSGAYNVLHAWFVETDEGVSPLAFAAPAFDVSRATDEFDSAVTGIKVTGMLSELMLVNSNYDPASGMIAMASMWRGIGDAFSTGEWRMVEGAPVLKTYEVDASYDGEQTPRAIYKAE